MWVGWFCCFNVCTFNGVGPLRELALILVLVGIVVAIAAGRGAAFDRSVKRLKPLIPLGLSRFLWLWFVWTDAFRSHDEHVGRFSFVERLLEVCNSRHFRRKGRRKAKQGCCCCSGGCSIGNACPHGIFG